MRFFRRTVAPPPPSRIPASDQPLLVDLLARLGDLEIKRMEAQVNLRNAEIDAKMKEIEHEQRLKKELADWRAERRRLSRETIRSQPRRANGRVSAKEETCRVCANPSEPSLSADEIVRHHAEHPHYAS